MSVYTLEPVARYLNAYRSQESQKYSRVPSNIKLETVTEKPVLTAESPVMQKAQKTVQEKNNFFLNPTSD